MHSRGWGVHPGFHQMLQVCLSKLPDVSMWPLHYASLLVIDIITCVCQSVVTTLSATSTKPQACLKLVKHTGLLDYENCSGYIWKVSFLSFYCTVLYEVELLSYIDHQAADDYDTFTEVNKKLLLLTSIHKVYGWITDTKSCHVSPLFHELTDWFILL